MKCRYLQIATFLLLYVVLACSSQVRKTPFDFINYENGKSLYTNSEEFLFCFGIEPKDASSYVRFERDFNFEESADNFSVDSLNDSMVQANRDLKLELAYDLKNHMQEKFRMRVAGAWEMEKIAVPVSYRHFYRFRNNRLEVKGVALILKRDLTVTTLLRYLPLEYKLLFLERLESEYAPKHPSNLRRRVE